MRKLTKEDFMNRSSCIHNNKYDYSKFIYINNSIKGIIICPKHGEFCQTPDKHMNGRGCKKCGTLAQAKKRILNKDKFIKQALIIHSGKNFDYSKFIYVNNCTKGIIICPKHGEFLQTPSVHNNTSGCPNCGILNTIKKLTSNIDIFIDVATKTHGDKYNYEKFIYAGAMIKGIIICPKHGEFLQTPSTHFSSGCSECGHELGGLKKRLRLETFISRAIKTHKNKYDYSKFICTDSYSKGIIICPKHGEFLQSASAHMRGAGCKNCRYKNQQIVFDFLKEKKIAFIPEYKIFTKNKIIKKRGILYCDFYIPSLNLIIEYNGKQHYEPCTFATDHKRVTKEKAKENLVNQQKTDNLRREHCKENNINLLEIDGRIYCGEKLYKYLENYFK